MPDDLTHGTHAAVFCDITLPACIVTRDGLLKDANQAFRNMLNLRQIKENTLLNLLSALDQKELKRSLAQTSHFSHFPFHLVNDSHSLHTLGASFAKLKDSEFLLLTFFPEDNSESDSRELKERYLSLYERSLNLVYLHDLNGHFLDANPATLNLLGYSREEILNFDFSTILADKNQLSKAEKLLTDIKNSGVQKDISRFKLRGKDGSVIWVETQASLVYRDGKPFAIQGIGRDITQQKKAESDKAYYLTELEIITDTLLNASKIERIDELCRLICKAVHQLNQPSVIIVSIFDPKVHGVRICCLSTPHAPAEHIYNLLGVHPERPVITQNILRENKDIYASGKLEPVSGGLYQLLGGIASESACKKTEKAFNIKSIHTIGLTSDNDRINGSISLLLKEKKPVRYKNAIESIASHLTMIFERKMMQQQLIIREQRYRSLFENASIALLVVEKDFTISYANQKFTDLTGHSEQETMTGKRIDDFIFDKDIAWMKDLLTPLQQDLAHTQGQQEIQIRDINNKPVHTLISVARVEENDQTIISLLDITNIKQAEQERKKLETQLRQSQKLETIGTLAGGIAHEFNNILTPILGYSDMIIADLSPDHPIYQDMKFIVDAANRAGELVDQMLTFSRLSEHEPKPLKPDLMIKEAVKLMQSSLPSSIQVKQNIHNNCDKILADPTQIHQLVINLCTNAFQAMEERGGTLSLKLIQIPVSEIPGSLRAGLSALEYIKFTVADTGRGMDASTLKRLFDPFYSTRDSATNRGLGLSVVHGIVETMNGIIDVQSQKMVGTTFDIYLPVLPAATNATPANHQQLGGHETIMIIDDEEAVISLLERMLSRMGYHVIKKMDSLNALETFSSRADSIDLVITDLTMPHLSGFELSQKMKAIQPSTPILLMTGYIEKANKIEQDNLFDKVIRKPVIVGELLDLVRNTLDQY
ncbi:MAG: PAS domain S-box protein [candidate division KSB1 bacterium]|nr:PAS domain S-box protein [candidate division KSB1 bacterium]